MTILRTYTTLACIAAAASAGQVPLQEDVPSHPVIESVSKKPTINSTRLQEDIKVENLLARAKHLSKIADLGIPEYNHPTRVIGSEGKFSMHVSRYRSIVFFSFSLEIECAEYRHKVILQLSTTSTRPLMLLGTTTTSPTRLSMQ